MSEIQRLTISEAKRLHGEAPAMTVAELRRLGEVHFKTQWLRSARKKTIVEGFQQCLKNAIAHLETEVW